MNFLSHGVAFLEDPYYLAGTAVPDWLCVADRTVRVRSRLIERFVSEQQSTEASPELRVAAGARQHLQDDDWFHGQRSFAEVCLELSGLFRAALGPDDNFRAGFLGHIVAEMLLDRVLIEECPRFLEKYYGGLAEVDPAVVEAAVNRIATRSTERLAPLLPRFLQERFLQDYTEEGKLLFRLNQVMRRVKLPILPERIVGVLRESFEVVRKRHRELLPEHVLACLPGSIRAGSQRKDQQQIGRQVELMRLASGQN
ncbi:MAG: hypothetical protein KDA76_16650 [Planctomycetaceae bacterium]|nr:hypothetical protein [Planctomycetaceae bacterium]